MKTNTNGINFDLVKALTEETFWVDFDGDVESAGDLANETSTLSKRDVIVLAKSDNSPLRLLSAEEAAGRLCVEWWQKRRK